MAYNEVFRQSLERQLPEDLRLAIDYLEQHPKQHRTEVPIWRSKVEPLLVVLRVDPKGLREAVRRANNDPGCRDMMRWVVAWVDRHPAQTMYHVQWSDDGSPHVARKEI